MKDEPEVIFQAYANSFTKSAQLNDCVALNIRGWRRCSAKQKRRRDVHAL
jgi:hypothetical protein